MISTNYLGTLFNCKVQQILNNNMIIKHIFGFLTLFFFVSLVDDELQISIMQKFIFSLLIYIWFVLSTKMYYSFWFIFISLFIVIYLLHNLESTLTDEKFKRYIKILNNALIIIAIVIMIVGIVYNIGIVKIQNKDYKFSKFIIGDSKCFLSKEVHSSLKDILYNGLFIDELGHIKENVLNHTPKLKS